MGNSITGDRHRDLACAFFAAVDRMNGSFTSFFVPDVRVCFANADPVIGRAAAWRCFAEFIDGLRACGLTDLRHDIVNVWTADGVVISELEVSYAFGPDRSVTVPAATVWRLSGRSDGEGVIVDYRVFVDHGPVHAVTQP